MRTSKECPACGRLITLRDTGKHQFFWRHNLPPDLVEATEWAICPHSNARTDDELSPRAKAVLMLRRTD